MATRYYWLKLPDNFFSKKTIKKLRRIAGGDTYTIIYLKMLLVAMKQDGKLYFDGVEDDFFDELALEIDEEPDNVRVACQYLIAQSLMQTAEGYEYILPECKDMTGKENSNTKNVRAYRERQKQKLLQCKTDVRECKNDVKNGKTEIEKEIEKEIEIEIETEIEKEKRDIKEKSNSCCLKDSIPKSIQEVEEYCTNNNYCTNPQKFFDYYQAKGWLIGNNKMTDWKAALRNWERREKEHKDKNKFNNFHQRQYDYGSLEKKLIGD